MATLPIPTPNLSTTDRASLDNLLIAFLNPRASLADLAAIHTCSIPDLADWVAHPAVADLLLQLASVEELRVRTISAAARLRAIANLTYLSSPSTDSDDLDSPNDAARARETTRKAAATILACKPMIIAQRTSTRSAVSSAPSAAARTLAQDTDPRPAPPRTEPAHPSPPHTTPEPRTLPALTTHTPASRLIAIAGTTTPRDFTPSVPPPTSPHPPAY